MTQTELFSMVTSTLNGHLERNLAFWSERLGSEKKALWRLRNATVQSVKSELLRKGQKPYCKVSSMDVCEDQLRADHYGVAVGDTISIIYAFHNEAKLTRQLKSEVYSLLEVKFNKVSIDSQG